MKGDSYIYLCVCGKNSFTTYPRCAVPSQHYCIMELYDIWNVPATFYILSAIFCAFVILRNPACLGKWWASLHSSTALSNTFLHFLG